RGESASVSALRRLPDGSTAFECSRPESPDRPEPLFESAAPTRVLESRSSRVTIAVFDLPSKGFNDPTPAAPVGGNTGTTLGQQRLNAVRFAADIWAAALDSPVEIRIGVGFISTNCTPDFTILGAAQIPEGFLDFPGAEFTGTWYPAALANRRAGRDLHPDDGTLASQEIAIGYNDLGRPACTEPVTWYYGLDGEHGDKIDLVRLTLHEIGHGLGFAPYASPFTGAEFQGHPDVFERRVLDEATGKHWHEMTDAERAASATNAPNVVWDGPAVTAAAPAVLRRGVPVLAAAGVLSGDREAGPADFGPAPTAAGISGPLAAASADGCSPLANGSELAGKVAFADLARLPCLWITQAFNFQKAGAIAVLLADYQDSGLPQRVTIVSEDPGVAVPTASITKADGASLRAALASRAVTVSLRTDFSRFEGVSASGRVRLYAPRLFDGSAIGHFDFNAQPPLLMNPFQGEPGETQSLDLTPAALRDIGWYPDSAAAAPRSPLRRPRGTRVEPQRK
ncbi:MAG TPA: PA domain-containing protein, partial [Thermoanaerobaculia bacterium]|nr:PA domain-containing protein [Thermoanaerobaculia bacterium]